MKTVARHNAEADSLPVHCEVVKVRPVWAGIDIESPWGGEIEEEHCVFNNNGLPRFTNRVRCSLTGRHGEIQYDGSVSGRIDEVRWEGEAAERGMAR